MPHSLSHRTVRLLLFIFSLLTVSSSLPIKAASISSSMEQNEITSSWIKISGVLPLSGQVLENFQISPNGAFVVYMADQDTQGVFELYSVPITGGSAVKLNKSLEVGEKIADNPNNPSLVFIISPDSKYVIYRAAQDSADHYELYSVPITGGNIVKLNGTMVSGGNIYGYDTFKISPDSTRVVYVADQDVDEQFELYSVPITGGLAKKLSGTDNPRIFKLVITPDSSYVVYCCEYNTESTTLSLYSTPIDGGVKNNLSYPRSIHSLDSLSITPDSQRLIYAASYWPSTNDSYVYVVPVHGGYSSQITNIWSHYLKITPDSKRVVYSGYQGNHELYSTSTDGGGSVLLNDPVEVMWGGINVSPETWNITPNGERVIYSAHLKVLNQYELYSASVQGGNITKLSLPLQNGDSVSSYSVRISPDSSSVIYMASNNIYNVSLDGGIPKTLNTPDMIVINRYLPVIMYDSRYAVYVAMKPDESQQYDIFATPLVGGTSVRMNAPLITNREIRRFINSPTQNRIVYLADQDVDNRNELYVASLIDGSTPPPPVADVKATFLEDGGNILQPETVQLSWRAPLATDVAGSDFRYVIRYSNKEIETEADWAMARQSTVALPEPHLGQHEKVNITGIPTGTRWYFAVRTINELGGLSKLVDQPNIQDAGFRPDRDGYGFKNYTFNWSTWLNNSDWFTLNDMRDIYGDSAICYAVVGGVCLPKLTAVKLHEWHPVSSSFGNCYGISASSLSFFNNSLLRPKDFQSGASVPFDLKNITGKLRAHITAYHMRQGDSDIQNKLRSSRSSKPNDILEQLRVALQSPKKDMVVLGFWVHDPDDMLWLGSRSGHAVVPFAIEDVSEDISRVWVYDSNIEPGRSSFILFDKQTNTWNVPGYRNNDLSYTYQGTANSHNLAIVSLAAIESTPECWWCNQQRLASGAGTRQIWASNDLHPLIKASSGQRIGYVNGQFVNDIPNATITSLVGGIGEATDPRYNLPIADDLSIAFDGSTITQTTPLSLTMGGPGFLFSVDATLPPGSHDEINASSDGKKVQYKAGSFRTSDFDIALDEVEASYRFQLGNLDIGAQRTVITSIDSSQQSLIINNAAGTNGAYNLQIDRTTNKGLENFVFDDIVIDVGDTQYLDYGTWNGNNVLTLRIDHGSDGTIDQIVPLGDQTNRIYLPLVVR